MAKRKAAKPVIIRLSHASRIKRAFKRNTIRRSLMPPPSELVTALRDATGVSKKTAERIAAAHPGGLGMAVMTEAGFRALGATSIQARRLRAAFTLVGVCDANCERIAKRTTIRDPRELANFLRKVIGRQEQENFVVILLNARQRVIDVLQVGQGSLAQVDIHPRELFRDAVKVGAHSIIIAHNHPSGEAEPSEADIKLTNRMAEIGRLVGIPLLDHIVVTPRDSVSLASLGLL